MYDFYRIIELEVTAGRGANKETVAIDICPDFIVGRSKDLMIRGKNFYAIWDEEKGLWSQDEYDVRRLVDQSLYDYREKLQIKKGYDNIPITVSTLASNRTKMWKEFKQYVSNLSDNYHWLDEDLTFLNTEVKKEDYVSKRLSYSLEEGNYSAWDTLVGRLYEPEEREKIEWCIGAVVSGDSKKIQKFAVFYGEPGAGKGTIISVIEKLFNGYYTTFDAKSLGSSSNQFATEAFRSNPLVVIQHDGDLSRIEDNTRINSIVSHEMMTMKEKFKPEYMGRANAFLFLGTNRPVKITDGRSGVIRRLIDIHPSNHLFSAKEYDKLFNQIDFELGAIAYHCLEVYKTLGKNYYRNYKPRDMIMKTDVFYNFVEAKLDIFEGQTEGLSLKQAYSMYKEYAEDAMLEFKLPMYKFREELKAYFEHFDEVGRMDGHQVRSWYSGFRSDKMHPEKLKPASELKDLPMDIHETESLLDSILADCPAQYTTIDEKPLVSWEKCKTKLSEIDPTKLHYILPRDADGARLPIVMIDFDLKNAEEKKDARLNMEAALKWPETYTEFSKGGEGIHLFYWYEGDLSKLATLYSPGIEVKTFPGNSSIRRRLSYCKNVKMATLKEGALPLKEEKVVNFYELKDTQHLVNKIKKSLRKGDNVGGTKCEIEFIKKTLDDAYTSGMSYDLDDYAHDVRDFAMHSSNHKDYCLQLVNQMHFQSKDVIEKQRVEAEAIAKAYDAMQPITFFDVEIYRPTAPGEVDRDGEENPGLFLICWKFEGKDQPVHSLINPKPYEVEELFKMKLVGFNNLKYDNYMLAARSLGYTNQQLYDLSDRIINQKAREIGLSWSRDISYTDVFDYCAKKQGLKKWEIELDEDHIEMAIPWNEPAPRSMWEKIVEYCSNDVIATEAVHNKNVGDFQARLILGEIADGTANDTTNTLTTKFIFGSNRHPQLVYTDLATGERSDGSHDDNIIGAFPGYEYIPAYASDDGKPHNMYRGVDMSFGGYVYSEPGIWTNVALLDVKSLHPHSIVAMRMFDDYTDHFKGILEARIAIKEHNYDKARQMFGGRLAKYLDDETLADAVAQALKIAINSVYGLTSASFDNPFRDKRNVNNIVALRGALFMKTLQDEVAARGFTVAHIKTDSIKIPNATPEIIQFCMDFAKKYGYEFDHEATYERMCLLDKAQYVAAYASPEWCEQQYGYIPSDNRKQFKKHNHPWTTTGDAFQHPYIFKMLFSGEPVEFKDMCETKQVKDAAIYLDLNEACFNVEDAEKELERRLFNQFQADPNNPKKHPKKLNPAYADMDDLALQNYISEGHHYEFVGRVGSFFPVEDGEGGGWLLALRNGKYSSVNGAKGYRWMEAQMAKHLNKQDCWSRSYFNNLVDGAIAAVNSFGSFDRFVDLSKPYDISEPVDNDRAPWEPTVPCGDGKRNDCLECPYCTDDYKCLSGYDLSKIYQKF